MRVTVYLPEGYDFTYGSYFLSGLDELSHRGQIDLKFKRGLPDFVDPAKLTRPDLLKFLTVFQVGERFRVLDTSDHPDSIDVGIARSVDAYFHCNPYLPWIEKYLPPDLKIRAAGIYFPVPYGPALSGRILLTTGPKPAILKDLYRSQKRYSLARLRSMRGSREQHDVFFNPSAWGTTDIRAAMIRELKKMPIAFYGGFRATPDALKTRSEEVLKENISTKKYFDHLAASRITLNTRGKHHCMAWKIGEQLAMGKFVLSQHFAVELPYALNDGEHLSFFEDDLSDFRSKIEGTLASPEKRIHLERHVAETFDRMLAPLPFAERVVAAA